MSLSRSTLVIWSWNNGGWQEDAAPDKFEKRDLDIPNIWKRLIDNAEKC